jgi:hypothetical protein
MILAILQNASSLETLLNNLSEADFDLADVSVLTQKVELRNAIPSNSGPLKGTQPDQIKETLMRAGVSEQNAELCYRAVRDGKVLVAMKVEEQYRPFAEEAFEDHSAQLIK